MHVFVKKQYNKYYAYNTYSLEKIFIIENSYLMHCSHNPKSICYGRNRNEVKICTFIGFSWFDNMQNIIHLFNWSIATNQRYVYETA